MAEQQTLAECLRNLADDCDIEYELAQTMMMPETAIYWGRRKTLVEKAATEVEALEADAAAWRELVELKDKLLVAYRVGNGRLPESFWRKLERVQAAIKTSTAGIVLLERLRRAEAERDEALKTLRTYTEAHQTLED